MSKKTKMERGVVRRMRCPRCGSNDVILATRCGSNDVILATSEVLERAGELSPPSEAMRAMELTPYYRVLDAGNYSASWRMPWLPRVLWRRRSWGGAGREGGE